MMIAPTLITTVLFYFIEANACKKRNERFEPFNVAVPATFVLMTCAFTLILFPAQIVYEEPCLEKTLIPVSMGSSTQFIGNGYGNFLYSRSTIGGVDYISFYYNENGYNKHMKIPTDDTKIVIVNDPSEVSVDCYTKSGYFKDILFGWKLEDAYTRDAFTKKSYVVKLMEDQFSNKIWVEP